MGRLANHQRTGGESVHVGDCYLWAQIYYLDSKTDYREYLSQTRAERPHTVRMDNAVLEPSDRSQNEAEYLRLGPMVFLFILLISALVSCWILEALQAPAVKIAPLAG